MQRANTLTYDGPSCSFFASEKWDCGFNVLLFKRGISLCRVLLLWYALSANWVKPEDWMCRWKVTVWRLMQSRARRAAARWSPLSVQTSTYTYGQEVFQNIKPKGWKGDGTKRSISSNQLLASCGGGPKTTRSEKQENICLLNYSLHV